MSYQTLKDLASKPRGIGVLIETLGFEGLDCLEWDSSVEVGVEIEPEAGIGFALGKEFGIVGWAVVVDTVDYIADYTAVDIVYQAAVGIVYQVVAGIAFEVGTDFVVGIGFEEGIAERTAVGIEVGSYRSSVRTLELPSQVVVVVVGMSQVVGNKGCSLGNTLVDTDSPVGCKGMGMASFGFLDKD